MTLTKAFLWFISNYISSEINSKLSFERKKITLSQYEVHGHRDFKKGRKECDTLVSKIQRMEKAQKTRE